MQTLLYYLPFLACPIGMGLMMWFMMRGMRGNTPDQAASPPERREPDAHLALPIGVAEMTREEQLTALRAGLAAVQQRQRAIADEMAALERDRQAAAATSASDRE